MTLPDLPEITRFARTLKEQTPPTQADPHQWQAAGNMTLEFGQVTAVNNSAVAVGGNAPFTCTVVIKGTSQSSIPWIGYPPNIGMVTILSQPPLTYVLGQASTQVAYAPVAGTAYCTGGSTLQNAFFAAAVGANENLSGGMQRVSTSGSGLQVPVAGLYAAFAQMAFSANPAGQVYIGLNNAAYKGGSACAAGNLAYFGCASGLVECNALDVINVGYDVANAVNFLISGSLYCYISAHLVER